MTKSAKRASAEVKMKDNAQSRFVIAGSESIDDSRYREVLQKLVEAVKPYVLHGSADLYLAYHKALDLLGEKKDD